MCDQHTICRVVQRVSESARDFVGRGTRGVWFPKGKKQGIPKGYVISRKTAYKALRDVPILRVSG